MSSLYSYNISITRIFNLQKEVGMRRGRIIMMTTTLVSAIILAMTVIRVASIEHIRRKKIGSQDLSTNAH